MQKTKDFIKKYIPIPALCLYILALLAAIVHVVSELSAGFSDFFNRYIGSIVRGIHAMLTNLIPLSLAETIIIFLPVIAVVTIVLYVKRAMKSNVVSIRFIASLLGVAAWMYSTFVFTTAVAYNGTTLSDKLGLQEELVDVAELRQAAEYMISEMDSVIDEVEFNYSGSSVMPYSISEMNDKLLSAYSKASEKYRFIPKLWSRVKQIALSEPMTYTHISGMYTYYTGEANLNINFPDYNLPFTAAHELAHQRGVLPENEANFVAFLVCMESDDPYIRYSGYANMYEYLNSALYSADYDIFAEVYGGLDNRFVFEMRSYNAFFKKYQDNVAATVSSTLNDNYLKAQGQTAGEKSYGMVVDLAVAWVKSLNAEVTE